MPGAEGIGAHDALQVYEARLDAIAAATETNVVRLKTELTSLRDALLRRNEDRASVTLTIERLNARVVELAGQVDEERERRHAAEEQIRGLSHELGRLNGDMGALRDEVAQLKAAQEERRQPEPGGTRPGGFWKRPGR